MKDKIDQLRANSASAATLLKTISNPNRMMVLCRLVEGEASVNELLENLSISQSALSQNLIKMKQEGILDARRLGVQNFYFIKHEAVADILQVLHKHFCKD